MKTLPRTAVAATILAAGALALVPLGAQGDVRPPRQAAATVAGPLPPGGGAAAARTSSAAPSNTVSTARRPSVGAQRTTSPKPAGSTARKKVTKPAGSKSASTTGATKAQPADRAAGTSPQSVGTGWKAYSKGSYIQFQVNGRYTRYPWKDTGTVRKGDGAYRYDAATDTETFLLSGRDTNRVEFHGAPYRDGQQQLVGEFRVDGRDVDSFWVAQAWHSVLLKWEKDDGGRLVYHSASEFDGDRRVDITKTLGTNLRGTWVRINLVHDADANRTVVYVNGKRAIDHPSGDSGLFYLKYGTYDSSGRDDESVRWRNTRIFRR